MADDAHAAGLQRGAGLPRGQQVLDDRVELLLGRVPRLEQVVVQRDLVDRLDRRRRVGVRGQQHPLGARDELPGGDEVIGARHPRHPLVGDQQRHLLAARDELAQQLEPLVARAAAHDPVAVAERPAQIARDRGEDRRLVVDDDDRRPVARALALGVLLVRGRCDAHAPTVPKRASRLGRRASVRS
jgi:hypothetical protein